MSKQVKDFVEGDHIKTRLLISSILKGVTNSGAPYLTVTLQDCTKSMEAKMWDVKPEIERELVAGKVYEFDLEIIKYKNNLQAKVLKVLPINQKEVKQEDYTFRSPVDDAKLRDYINDSLNEIENPNIIRIVSRLLANYDAEFYSYPAASKIHHNFIGGLATHVYGMLQLAKTVADIYPSVNRDYLYAGVILHDIGKVDELSSPVLTEYTVEGKLLGHISIMDAKLAEVGRDLKLEDSEEILILRHMILAHHGQYEYGSPVLPMTLEAEILSLIDNLDARVNTITKAFDGVQEGEFTQRIFALDNRNFYKHK